MSDEIKKKIEELENEILLLKGIKVEEKKTIPSYQFSKMTDLILEKWLDIEQKIDKTKFNVWFNNSLILDDKINSFLNELLEIEGDYLNIYDEEDLKMRFLSPLLRSIDFKTKDFRDFYDEKLRYETDKFIFNGETDFVVSTGLRRAKKPYFFIQEFKKIEKDSYPRPQLLAELISAVELNDWKTIKGAYIVGSIWNFVILEKLGKDKYQYFISKEFNSSEIDGLKSIYKNLLFIKAEVIKMVDERI